MQRKRASLLLGAGFALALVGTSTIAGVGLAQPREDTVPVSERSVLPAGETYTVSESGDSGPGTFGAAVEQINDGGASATILFSTDVTLTSSWEVSQNVTIQGAGATVRWTPTESQWGGPLLSVERGTAQIHDLTIALEGETYSPMISLYGASAEFTTVLENVTLRNPHAGGVTVGESAGNVEISKMRASGYEETAEAVGAAALEIWGSTAGVSLVDSEFTQLRGSVVGVSSAQIEADQHVLLRGNRFVDLNPGVIESSGAVVAVNWLDARSDAERSSPPLLLEDNSFVRVGDSELRPRQVVYLDSITGAPALRNNTFESNFVEEAVVSASGLFEAGSSADTALSISGGSFYGNTSNGEIIGIEDAFLSVALENIEITKSLVQSHAVRIERVAPDTPHAGPAVTIRDTVLDGVGGQYGTEDPVTPDTGALLRDLSGGVLLDSVTVSDVDATAGATLVTWAGGTVTVRDSEYAGNSTTGLIIDEPRMRAVDQIQIERSVFSDNESPTSEHGAGLSIFSAFVNEESHRRMRGDSPIQIRDSSFLGNSGGQVAGAWIMTAGGADSTVQAAPEVLFENTTFWNPDTDSGDASDLFLTSNLSDESDSPPATVLRNSTVERRDAVAPELPALQVENANVSLEHVSMPGGTYAQHCGIDSGLTVRNSALGSDAGPAFDLGKGCEIDGFANTVPVRGEIPETIADELPLDEWLLGELGDNGGKTLTVLPDVQSPLRATAEASDVLVDQRGVVRPQGDSPDRGSVEREFEASIVEIGPDVEVQAGEVATLEVTRSGDTTQAARASVELRDGSAQEGKDYVAKEYTLEWEPGGGGAQTIEIETLRQEAGVRQLTAAVVAPVGTDLGERSVANVTIVQDDPVTDPGTDPVTDPGTDPVTDPGTDPVTDPGTDPVTDPGTDPVTDPGTDPVSDPGTDPVSEPGTDSVSDPGTDPVSDPGTDPGADPSTDPATEPKADQGVTPTPNPLAQTGSLSSELALGLGALLIGAAAAVMGARRLRAREDK